MKKYNLQRKYRRDTEPKYKEKLHKKYKKWYIKNKKQVYKNNIKKRRQKIRKIKKEYGNKCQICGYNKCISALQFHHPNDNKTFRISAMGSKGINKIRAEASKCILICANCHAEIHNPEEKQCHFR